MERVVNVLALARSRPSSSPAVLQTTSAQEENDMALAVVLFLLAAAALVLLTSPFAMLVSELEDVWVNLKFWAVVIAAWAAVFGLLSLH